MSSNVFDLRRRRAGLICRISALLTAFGVKLRGSFTTQGTNFIRTIKSRLLQFIFLDFCGGGNHGGGHYRLLLGEYYGLLAI